MPITHRTELASCCPGELATSSIIMKALRGVSGVLSRGRSPGKLNHIKADSSGLGVVGSLVRQEPNNSVYLASLLVSCCLEFNLTVLTNNSFALYSGRR